MPTASPTTALRMLRAAFAPVPESVTPGASTARTSLRRSVEVALSGGVGFWLLLLSAVVLLDGRMDSARTLTTAAGNVAGAALLTAAALRPGLSPRLCLLPMYALIVANGATAQSLQSPVLFGATWLANFAAIMAALVVTSRWVAWVVVPANLAVLIGLRLAHPHWPASFWVSLELTALAITAIVIAGYRQLEWLAHHLDVESEQTRLARRTSDFTATARRHAAETARVLHDTVINTLLAVASGDVRRPELVRLRAAGDSVVLGGLMAGDTEARPAETLDVAAIAERLGLELVHTGTPLTDEVLTAATVPDHVRLALHGATVEALQNVAKHAGTDRAVLDVRLDQRFLTVTVTDHGSASSVMTPGRGLTESIFARCQEAGVTAGVASNSAGGTDVTLTYRLPRPVRGAGHIVSAKLHTLRSRLAWSWGAGVTVVGVCIVAPNRLASATAVVLMLLTDAAVSGFAWRVVRSGARLSTAANAALAALAPAMFMLSAWTVDFGRTDAIYWQTLGPTIPVVVLLISSTPFWRTVALVTLSATVVTAASIVADSSPSAGGALLLGGTTASGVAVVIGGLVKALDVLTARADAELATAEQSRLLLERQRAVTLASERWRAAGLASCRLLLEQLADGRLDPTDPTVQARCAREERRLRQLILLDPGLVYSAPALFNAINDAYERGVLLTIRSGEDDLSAADTGIGATVERDLSAMVGLFSSGSEVVIALLPTTEGLSLSIVGPAAGFRDTVVTGLDDVWEIHRLTNQWLARRVFPR